ncbi:alpha/beta fold hydrolase [Thermoleophilia bacterium SCSIO 60948]|nr:alpha/beta fold hydrolase [Thermoleophilia bacterium SCSIO 60948]
MSERRGAEEFDVTSLDGTVIAAESYGRGPAVVLVDGALSHRALGPMPAIAERLADEFTVFTYDRRGRGASGDEPPYAADREVEDLAAVAEAAGAPAAVFGLSSGAALALLAATRSPAIGRLAVHEPPLSAHADPDHATHTAELHDVLTQRGPGAAVDWFLAQIGMPPHMLEEMHASESWPAMEAVGHTLSYDYAVLGEIGDAVDRFASVSVPTQVSSGEHSPDFFRAGATAIAAAIPRGEHRELAGIAWGQPSPDPIAAAAADFLRA